MGRQGDFAALTACLGLASPSLLCRRVLCPGRLGLRDHPVTVTDRPLMFPSQFLKSPSAVKMMNRFSLKDHLEEGLTASNPIIRELCQKGLSSFVFQQEKVRGQQSARRRTGHVSGAKGHCHSDPPQHEYETEADSMFLPPPTLTPHSPLTLGSYTSLQQPPASSGPSLEPPSTPPPAQRLPTTASGMGGAIFKCPGHCYRNSSGACLAALFAATAS